MGAAVAQYHLLLALLILAVLGSALPCWAHPLGNFSISQYSALRIAPQQIEIRYLLDFAEIPAFQEMQEHGLSTAATEPELAHYLAQKALVLKRNLHLLINGRALALQAEPESVTFPPGAGGLPTMKVALRLRARWSASGEVQLAYADNNYPERIGWKEIIAATQAGIHLRQSSVPERDRSHELNDYPADLLDNPPQVRQAYLQFSVAPPAQTAAAPRPSAGGATQTTTKNTAPSIDNAGPAATRRAPEASAVNATLPRSIEPAPAETTTTAPPRTPRSALTELMAERRFTGWMMLFAGALAVGLGALHALEPGHGKTLVAAYLVGSHGTLKHALALGAIVTVAHTAGVYLLGAITLLASRYIVPERIYPWLALASGIIIFALGAMLFVRRAANESDGRHHHAHDPAQTHRHRHRHDAGPSHDHGHGAAVSFKQLVSLGVAGGIVPCPAALVVLLSAVTFHRVGLGLLLIVCFSIGLAAVLIAVGVTVLYAKNFMRRFTVSETLTLRWLPLASSTFIMLFGLALIWQTYPELQR